MPLSHLADDLIRKDEIRTGTIFISYSRRNREFAIALYEKLTTIGFDLWRDVHGIPAGEDWWDTIKDAIDHSETMILCMSMASLKSPVVSDEWFYARQHGKRVIPVIVDEIWNHPDVKSGEFAIPNWMTRANWLDFRKETPENTKAWANLIGTLNTPYEPKHFVSMAGELPLNYVRREKEIETIIRALVDDNQDAVAMTTALRGAGGYGKTTLAKAIARDVRIQGAFDDGILWVTLGEELLQTKGDALTNKLTSIISELVYKMSEKRPVMTTLEGAREELEKAISDRYILMVIDDVWDAAHLKPFYIKGKNSATLITTRNADTLPKTGVEEQAIDRMKAFEGVELLSAGFAPEDVAPHREQLQSLADDLRGYPLLLSLVNAQMLTLVHDLGMDIDEALTEAQDLYRENGVAGFDDEDAVERENAVSKTLDVSLSQLKEEEAQRYRELAIFPEDTRILLSTLSGYWGLSKAKTLQFCLKLYKRTSLLQDMDKDAIRLHDVFRDYLWRQWTDEERAQLHNRLLESWPDWRNLPDDYAWQWLVYHLKGANRLHDLRPYLQDFNWLQAKLDATDANALLADFEQVLEGGDDDTLRLIESAVSMSAHVIGVDKTQLGNQLYGRLLGHHDRQPTLAAFLEQAKAKQGTFELLHPTLSQAGGALIKTIPLEGSGNDLVLTEDGEHLIIADGEKVKVVKWSMGEVVTDFTAHTSAVTGVSVSGELAFSASSDGTVKVWRWSTGEVVTDFTAHSGWVTGVSVSGELAFSASFDGTVKVWRWSTGEVVTDFTAHRDTVTAVSVSGELAFSASSDGTVKVWRWSTGEVVTDFTAHSGWVTGVSVSGELAFSASFDGTVKVWRWSTGEVVTDFTAHRDTVNAVSVSGELAFSASGDKTVKVWRWSTGEVVTDFTAHRDTVTAVSVSGELAFSASLDDTVKVWRWSTGEVVTDFTAHTSNVNAVSVSGELAFSASSDGTVKVWRWSTGEVVTDFTGLCCKKSETGYPWSAVANLELERSLQHGQCIQMASLPTRSYFVVCALVSALCAQLSRSHRDDDRTGIIGRPHNDFSLGTTLCPRNRPAQSSPSEAYQRLLAGGRNLCQSPRQMDVFVSCRGFNRSNTGFLAQSNA